MSCLGSSMVLRSMDKITKVEGVIHPREKAVNVEEFMEDGEPSPLELKHCTIYPVTNKNKFMHINDAGDIYESSVSSVRDAKRIARWLLDWAEWKGKRK